MSKIIYEHTNGDQTAVSVDPQMAMEHTPDMASLPEMWLMLPARIRADAAHTEQNA